ncbi:unnamed protein product [Calypogeia fissa]
MKSFSLLLVFGVEERLVVSSPESWGLCHGSRDFCHCGTRKSCLQSFVNGWHHWHTGLVLRGGFWKRIEGEAAYVRYSCWELKAGESLCHIISVRASFMGSWSSTEGHSFPRRYPFYRQVSVVGWLLYYGSGRLMTQSWKSHSLLAIWPSSWLKMRLRFPELDSHDCGNVAD